MTASGGRCWPTGPRHEYDHRQPVSDLGEVSAYRETTAAVQEVTDARCGDDLAAMVEQIDAVSLLRSVITLADEAPAITDKQLADRLVALTDRWR